MVIFRQDWIGVSQEGGTAGRDAAVGLKDVNGSS